MRERPVSPLSAWLMLLLLFAATGGVTALLVAEIDHPRPAVFLLAIAVYVLSVFALTGLFIVNPNEARVLLFFGKYAGTVKRNGFHWMIPLYSRRAITLRAVSFESSHLKVNDLEGNPIEIAAIIVWRVVDTAAAAFQVDDYAQYVRMQSEAALRDLAMRYPYDGHSSAVHSLRSHTHEVAAQLKNELQERCALAGVGIMDARISHLAYAPEIAHAMLQRQQAGAIIAARQLIVEGAVGMVEMALGMLSTRGVVQLDEQRKASMVANLLIVLCGERGTQPIVNAGSV